MTKKLKKVAFHLCTCYFIGTSNYYLQGPLAAILGEAESAGAMPARLFYTRIFNQKIFHFFLAPTETVLVY